MVDGTCSIDGCTRVIDARELCNSHYQHALRHGLVPRLLVRRGASLEERLEHHGWTVTETGCWEWAGRRLGNRYGQITVNKGRQMLAHRAAYLAWVGPLDGPKTFVCHRCDNPPCINPAHLFSGTSQENFDDMVAKKRAFWHQPEDVSAEDFKREIRALTDASGLTTRAFAERLHVDSEVLSRWRNRGPVPRPWKRASTLATARRIAAEPHATAS